jgi:hypothetical protein
LRYTANAFQANGDFTLNFKVNEKGDITDVKLYLSFMIKDLKEK